MPSSMPCSAMDFIIATRPPLMADTRVSLLSGVRAVAPPMMTTAPRLSLSRGHAAPMSPAAANIFRAKPSGRASTAKSRKLLAAPLPRWRRARRDRPAVRPRPDHRLRRAARREIDRQRIDLCRVRRERGARVGKIPSIARHEEQPVTVAREAFGDAAANPSARAGDDDPLRQAHRETPFVSSANVPWAVAGAHVNVGEGAARDGAVKGRSTSRRMGASLVGIADATRAPPRDGSSAVFLTSSAAPTHRS
jgi:hypothetical protein